MKSLADKSTDFNDLPLICLKFFSSFLLCLTKTDLNMIIAIQFKIYYLLVS